MRLKLVPQETNWDFFSRPKLWLGISVVLIVLAFVSFGLRGLNYGIDFRGGTTIRTESAQPVDVGAYRDALTPLELGDVVISEVFDPTFDADQNVAMVRIQAQDDQESVTAELINSVEAALAAAADLCLEIRRNRDRLDASARRRGGGRITGSREEGERCNASCKKEFGHEISGLITFVIFERSSKLRPKLKSKAGDSRKFPGSASGLARKKGPPHMS